MNEATKRCPYCAEEILQAAIKCKHCGERLDAAAGLSSQPAIAARIAIAGAPAPVAAPKALASPAAYLPPSPVVRAPPAAAKAERSSSPLFWILWGLVAVAMGVVFPVIGFVGTIVVVGVIRLVAMSSGNALTAHDEQLWREVAPRAPPPAQSQSAVASHSDRSATMNLSPCRSCGKAINKEASTCMYCWTKF